jgi:hypothetical protein
MPQAQTWAGERLPALQHPPDPCSCATARDESSSPAASLPREHCHPRPRAGNREGVVQAPRRSPCSRAAIRAEPATVCGRVEIRAAPPLAPAIASLAIPALPPIPSGTPPHAVVSYRGRLCSDTAACSPAGLAPRSLTPAAHLTEPEHPSACMCGLASFWSAGSKLVRSRCFHVCMLQQSRASTHIPGPLVSDACERPAYGERVRVTVPKHG